MRVPAFRSLLVTFLLPVLASAPLAAQGGWTQEKFPELGLAFPRARNYEQIPVPPDEEVMVLDFAEKTSEVERAGHTLRPDLMFVWIDKVPDAVVRTGPDPAAPPDGGEGGGDEPASKDPPKKDEPAKKPINSIERLVEQRFDGWHLGKPVEGRERTPWKAREFTLQKRKGKGETGWVYAWEGPTRTIALVGVCHESDVKEQVKIWRYTAEHLEIKEPEEKSPEKLQLFYARKPLRAIDYRIERRLGLVRGWKAEDTDNYIVLYDTPDQPLLRKIVRDLELLRKEYEKLFPPAKPVEAVSTVRVCKDRSEYFQYGGPESSAGYWNWNAKELVFYDAETVDRTHQRSDADTFIALYHEAFHQYIHYSTGELPPHSWFNEGHGDYFSGAQIKDGKLRAIGPNPWRVRLIQAVIAAKKTIPWKEMIRYEQPQYYKRDVVHICYAQGWAMIYFLRKSDVVAKRPEWAKILPTYFDVLKATYAEELAKLSDAEREQRDGEARAKAGLAARTHAVDEAFAGVDIDEIEQAWETFVLGIDDGRTRR